MSLLCTPLRLPRCGVRLIARGNRAVDMLKRGVSIGNMGMTGAQAPEPEPEPEPEPALPPRPKPAAAPIDASVEVPQQEQDKSPGEPKPAAAAASPQAGPSARSGGQPPPRTPQSALPPANRFTLDESPPKFSGRE